MTIAKFHNKSFSLYTQPFLFTLFVFNITASCYFDESEKQVTNHLLQTVLNILTVLFTLDDALNILPKFLSISHGSKQFLYPGRPYQVRSFWTCLQWVPEPSCSMNSWKNTTAMQNNGNTFILFWIVQCQELLLFLQLRCCWLRGCRGRPTPGLIFFCWLTQYAF